MEAAAERDARFSSVVLETSGNGTPHGHVMQCKVGVQRFRSVQAGRVENSPRGGLSSFDVQTDAPQCAAFTVGCKGPRLHAYLVELVVFSLTQGA